MRGVTHLTVGCVAAAVLSDRALIPIAAAGIGALLPDLDEAHSVAGRRLWPLSTLTQILFGHRGWWHSLLGLVVAGAVTYWLTSAAIAEWVAVGFATHLALDALTPAGVRPLWPASWRLRGPVRTGGVGDLAIAGSAFAIGVWRFWTEL